MWKLIFAFAIFPLLVVAAAVSVFLLFGMLAERHDRPEDYLLQMKNGSTHKRWQAAYELSRWLASKQVANKGPFEEEMLSLLAEAKPDETDFKKYLMIGLGQIGGEKSGETLLELAKKTDNDETRIYAVWSLG